MAKNNGREWLDVSVPLYPGMVHWPGDPEFNSDLDKSLKGGDVCNLTKISTSVHIGTHMDAPRHFIAGGQGIDEMPLDATIGPCRVLEIRDKAAIRPEEILPHKLRRGERVLFKTRNSSRAWKSQEFVK